MSKNTVASNHQPTTVTQSRGAGIYADPVNAAAATGENNIIYYNQAYANSEVYGNVSFTYSCLSTNMPGTGNITSSPQFVNPQYYLYQLQANSPCIDTGNPDPIYNDPDCTRSDMGALYFPQVAGITDLTIRWNHGSYLNWGEKPCASYYKIYGSENPYFILSPENLIDSTATTTYVVPTSKTRYFYKITVVSE